MRINTLHKIIKLPHRCQQLLISKPARSQLQKRACRQRGHTRCQSISWFWSINTTWSTYARSTTYTTCSSNSRQWTSASGRIRRRQHPRACCVSSASPNRTYNRLCSRPSSPNDATHCPNPVGVDTINVALSAAVHHVIHVIHGGAVGNTEVHGATAAWKAVVGDGPAGSVCRVGSRPLLRGSGCRRDCRSGRRRMCVASHRGRH
mmetsp:Transcript_2803/g.6555  ORF Transcript_2803/g.6555 Transcript_2803/m.6555 type:complete len:205 (+) Transcript_2803:1276-1890(+)